MLAVIANGFSTPPDPRPTPFGPLPDTAPEVRGHGSPVVRSFVQAAAETFRRR